MSDNIILNPGSRGPTVSTKDIGSGIQLPRTMLSTGGSGGTPTDISSSNPLWVTGIGTAGTADTGVLTVQGIASMTPLSVTVTNPSGGAVDESSWTAGSSDFDPVGGVFNDSAAALTSGQQGTARSTPNRAIHINLRNNSGTEIGTSGNPVRIDPTGTTTQPVAGTLTNNNAAPSTNNIGVLPALANTSAPTYTNGDQVLLSTDTSGNLRITGTVTANAGTGTFTVSSAVADESSWTAGSSVFTPVGGVFNDSAAALTSGQEGTVRSTANRGMHVNLRNASGTEIGTNANPVNVVSSIATIVNVTQSSTSSYVVVTGSLIDTATYGSTIMGWQFAETGGTNGITCKVQASFDNTNWTDQFLMDGSANKYAAVDIAVATNTQSPGFVSPMYEYAVHSAYRYYQVLVKDTVGGSHGSLRLDAIFKS